MSDINHLAPEMAQPQEPLLPSEEKEKQPLKDILLELLQTVALAVILFFIIDAVVARVRVENVSMLPTLHEGEFLLVNKLAYRLGGMNYGDIVVFHAPVEPGKDYIKRLIGLPGDNVVVADGKVKVNGKAFTEPYISAPPQYNGQWTVPQDSAFVLGDNRNESSDSHQWGFVPLKNMVGKAIVIYWPFNQFRVLNSPQVVSASSGQ
jgi:signal peptidase I